MAEQEILLEILSQLKSLNKRQTSVEEKLDVLDKRQTSVEEKLDVLDKRQTMVEEKLDVLDKRQTIVEEKLDALDKRQNMMAEELVAFQEFTVTNFERMDQRLSGLETKLNDLTNDLRKTNLTIENEIKPTLKALADGHIQMQAQLNRIEHKVMAHEEVIFRRVK